MIRITGLSKRFNAGSIDEILALKGIDLFVDRHEFVTVIGTNGSGKSTLLNMIAGNIQPDQGIVEIDGKDFTGKKEYQRAAFISRVFQNPYLGTAPGMTIAENLLMAYYRGKPRYPRISLTRTLTEIFKDKLSVLEMRLEDRLDPKTANQVIRLTQKFVSEAKLTTLMITHSMKQALEMGDRTIMMHNGRIIDDIAATEKKQLTVEDLLNKFEDIRKQEKLTPELISFLKNQYA